MSSHLARHYRIRSRIFCAATAVLTAVFICAKFAFSDVLTLGYAMMVPVFVFVCVVIEDARIEKRDLGRFRIGTEMAIAAAGAIGTGYLGYRLWLLGY